MESTSGWGDFLVAAAGAAGALAGLLFVALSINLTRILELPGVVGRAEETLLLLASALIGALLALIPGQPPAHLGWWFIALWVPTWGLPTLIQIRAYRHREYHRVLYAFVRFILHQAATVPLLLAGLSLAGDRPGGMHWFAASLLLSLVVALVNAWVLLIEIVR